MPTTFAKTIDGNDIFAKRAECDAAGNDLSTTYATKTELPDGVPAVTSSDDGKVLKASYTGGTGSFSWETESGGGGSYTAGTGIDITNDVISVDTSVVATQTDLADKEDAFDVGTGLEMDTSGATPTLQVEAPVDIVAGPGIVIDNPDGNTLRVSQAYPTDETVLYDCSNNYVYGTNSVTLSESYKNFEVIKILNSKGNVQFYYPANSHNVSVFTLTNMTNSYLWLIPWTFTSDTVYSGSTGKLWNVGTTTAVDVPSNAGSNRWIQPIKIIGIHRIAGGN